MVKKFLTIILAILLVMLSSCSTPKTTHDIIIQSERTQLELNQTNADSNWQRWLKQALDRSGIENADYWNSVLLSVALLESGWYSDIVTVKDGYTCVGIFQLALKHPSDQLITYLKYPKNNIQYFLNKFGIIKNIKAGMPAAKIIAIYKHSAYCSVHNTVEEKITHAVLKKYFADICCLDYIYNIRKHWNDLYGTDPF